ncbi:Predicted oxidoreductase [Streptoalloteichus hindustanus]|uniref:Predicted oxidoreductase n=2 Tax=Streptoalloteichus hindustanus TaxID=2017 RepID=A0A1M5IGB7_STRHI|nr:Predicted oxidoreductase [Streptoalloteichus hindustanus]
MRSYEQAAPLLDAFVLEGGTALDVAAAYGDGTCESVVGRWLRERGPGDSVVLVGKGAHPPRCSPEHVARDVSASLDRLGVDCIDLYLLHRDDEQVPAGEWVDALEAEARTGRIHAYGASNWMTSRVREADACAMATGAQGFVALSNHFSLARMTSPLYPGCVGVDEADLEWLVERRLALLPWSSQARGFFSDVRPELLDPKMWRCWDDEDNRERRRRAEVVAAVLGVRAINVALAFVLAQPVPTFPLIGPQDEAQLAIALDALDVRLDQGLLRWLVAGGPLPASLDPVARDTVMG